MAPGVRAAEVRAAGQLVAGAIGGGVSLMRDVHLVVAARSRGRSTSEVEPPAAYGVLHAAGTTIPRAAAGLLARVAPGGPVRGPAALGALNGAFGDALARSGSDLALPMTLRRHGAPLELADLSSATGQVVVFVHGLCKSERAWSPSARGQRSGHVDFGPALEADCGWTALHLRYNSGLHISENGRRLARLLEELVAGWPVPVERLALVGHSMGGLVVRSACHYGEADASAWTRPLRDVVCLGTPHLGAPLEKGANAVAWALARFPEARPFAALLNLRSSGIKDLRFGACVDEDWGGCDPDELLWDRCREVPFLPSARYRTVAATVGPAGSPAGRVLGDLLVHSASASGRGRRRRLAFGDEDVVLVPGLSHLRLVDRPVVYEHLCRWLTQP